MPKSARRSPKRLRLGKGKEEHAANELKGRTNELKQVEERLIRKEELPDKRHTNLELEPESLAKKNEEVGVAKAEVEKLAHSQQEKL